jgi:predicted  nucleic acid-binding Zn-ribbon protein
MSLQIVLKEIRKRKQEIGEAMIYGNVKDMEHYRQLVGNVESLQMIEDRINEILSKIESDE